MNAPVPGATAWVVRRAVPNDCEAVAAAEKLLFSDPWSSRAFADLVDRPGVHFLVGMVDDTVAGYAIAYFAADEAELANLAVVPAWHRHGVGRRLLDAVLEAVHRDGAVEIWLEVRESNAAARALYDRAGFTEVGLRRRYYDRPVEDAIVMRRATALR
ncbi:MAG: ribosomal protein S18-alanine N-acetyltransferase [Cytophagaceae bacterium]|nr:ribosomal protein S18-alanine N-acetyltransferase [Gemmatimonadaceae bacterium]